MAEESIIAQLRIVALTMLSSAESQDELCVVQASLKLSEGVTTCLQAKLDQLLSPT